MLQLDFPRVPSLNLLAVQLASAIAILFGSLVLIGWGFDIEVLKSGFFTTDTIMKANTALCLVLSGVSLWLSLLKEGKTVDTSLLEDSQPQYARFLPDCRKRTQIIARLCAIAVMAISLLTLGQYIFDWNLGIDEILFHDDYPYGPTPYPGRMGINSALALVFIGRGLELLVYQKNNQSFWYAQVFALVAAFISLLTIAGYAYDVGSLYDLIVNTTSMGLHTAVALFILCIGILWRYPDRGIMQVVTSDTFGGLLTRRLLLVAMALPFFLGLLVVKAIEADYYQPASAISLFAISLMVIYAALIWQTATMLDRFSLQRDRHKAALEENEERLRAFVDANVIGILMGDLQGNITQANDEFLRMIGYSREDLLGGRLRFLDITPPEYLLEDEQRIAEAKLKGACNPYEKQYIHKNGNRVPVLVGYALVGEKRSQSIAFILDLSSRKQAEAALRQTEERFRLAVENFPDEFGIYDAQLRLQYINRAALERVQKPEEEILGRTDEEIFPPEIVQNYLPTLIAAQQTRTSQTVEATINLPGRETLITQIKYVPVLDQNGEIYQILAFNNDITGSKQASEILRSQKKWLEYVLNLMPVPMLFIEPGTARVTFANQAADELAGGEFLTGKPDEEYTSYRCTDAWGNTIARSEMPTARVARGERLQGLEIDWHTPLGVRSLLLFADTLPALYGHPATCVMAFQEITKRKEAEKELAKGNDKLQLLFDTASELLSSRQPLALLDNLYCKLAEQIGLDYYFNYLVEENESVMRLASYSGISEEMAKEIELWRVGEALCGTVAATRLPIVAFNLQQSTDPKAEFVCSLGVTAYYGHPLIVQGRLLGTLSFASTTRSSFTQNEIAILQAVCDQFAIAMERSSLIASLQEQTEQLKEANRMKDEFLAIISHELRSPLNAILGWAQLLQSRKLDEAKTAKALETIERNARGQTQLIEDLLDISRMIRGKLRLCVRNCELQPIIDAALDTVHLAAQAKNIEIRTSISTNKIMVSGDGERLQQVLWNLLSNAIKFTPNGGRVEVGVSLYTRDCVCLESSEPNLCAEQYAVITVKDTGTGIIPEFLPYVFDRFRQADSSNTRTYGGLGLGLAIVRHIVEMHGGTVEAESLGAGFGATFTVKIPLSKSQQFPYCLISNNSARSSLLAATCETLTPSLDGVRVLVVDDEADTRDFLTAVLEQCHAQVKAVASAQEALEIIFQWSPDVLVSDIGMPDEDGYSLIRKVRYQERTRDRSLAPRQQKNMPAAALTAHAKTEDRIQAIQEGFQIHLSKPVEAVELATVVASLAGRS